MKASRITIVGAVAAGLALAPSALAIGPSDFVVNIPDGPTQMGPPAGFNPTQNCDRPLPTAGGGAPPSGTYTCPGSYSWSSSATPMTGTVQVVSTGQTGTIALKCDWNLTNTMTVAITFPPGSITPTTGVSGFSGTGGQACSWEIKVGSSTLIGTLVGTTLLEQVNPTTGRFTGNLNINVVGGTGEYANAVGPGTFVQVQEFPFPTPTAPPLPSGGLPSGGLPSGGLPPGVNIPGLMRAMERGAVEAQAGSSMKMTLKTGKATGRFIVPSGKVTKTTKWKVHLAASPKSKCTITATKGKKTVTLARNRSTGTTGSIVGSGYAPVRLAAAGGTGTWNLKAACTKGATKFNPTRKLVLSK